MGIRTINHDAKEIVCCELGNSLSRSKHTVSLKEIKYGLGNDVYSRWIFPLSFCLLDVSQITVKYLKFQHFCDLNFMLQIHMLWEYKMTYEY